MKERMITRTIETYEVKCFYANTETMTMGECYLHIPGAVPESKLDREARKAFEASPIYGAGPCAFVSVKETHKVAELYGMTEADFISHAKLLPPR